MPRIIFFSMFLFVIFCSSCHRVYKHSVPAPPSVSDVFQPQEEAEQLLLSLKNINSELKTFKGMGSIKIWEIKRHYSLRTAWVGTDKKLRIEVFGASGLPAESIASDGNSLYLFSHYNKRFYKTKLGKRIEKKLPIPISFSDIISILSGRVPVYHHTYIFFKKNVSPVENVLILKNNRHNVIEKIFVDKSTTTVTKIEIYNKDGSMEYRAVFNNFHEIQTYKIPLNVEIENNDTIIQIITDKYWANVSVLPSTFVLTAP